MLNNQNVFFNNVIHSWVCLNQTRALSLNGPACSTTDACGNVNLCCQSESVSLWGINRTVGTFCQPINASGVTTFQQYNVGASPNNFTANVSVYGQCIPRIVNPQPGTSPSPDSNEMEPGMTSSADALIKTSLLCLVAFFIAIL